MTYTKKELRKRAVRSARIFTLDMPRLPAESSVAELEKALQHWPDFVRLQAGELSLEITLREVSNKLGRPWTDDELLGRLVDLAVKLLSPG